MLEDILGLTTETWSAWDEWKWFTSEIWHNDAIQINATGLLIPNVVITHHCKASTRNSISCNCRKLRNMDITIVVKHYQIWTCVITGSRAKLKFLLQKNYISTRQGDQDELKSLNRLLVVIRQHNVHARKNIRNKKKNEAKPHTKIIGGATDPKQHDFEMQPSASAPPKVLIWQNPLKSVEIWPNRVITNAKSLDVLWFEKNGAQKQNADVFFIFVEAIVWRHLGKNRTWCALSWKKWRPKWNAEVFFEVIFYSFSRASLGKFGRKHSNTKFCLLLHLS